MNRPPIDVREHLSHIISQKKPAAIISNIIGQIHKTHSELQELISTLQEYGYEQLVAETQHVLTKIEADEQLIEEQQKLLNDEHYEHIKEQNHAALIAMLQTILQNAKKEADLFSKKLGSSFKEIATASEKRMAALQQQLAATLDSYRQNNEAIYNLNKKLVTINNQITNSNQALLNEQTNMVNNLEQHWRLCKQGAPKPSFKEIVQAILFKQPAVARTAETLFSDLLEEMRLTFVEKKQTPQELSAPSERTVSLENQTEAIDKAELLFREHLSQNIATIFTPSFLTQLGALETLEKQRQNIEKQLKSLQQKETELQQEVKVLSTEIQKANTTTQLLSEKLVCEAPQTKEQPRAPRPN